jgi:hypothetical protein
MDEHHRSRIRQKWREKHVAYFEMDDQQSGQVMPRLAPRDFITQLEQMYKASSVGSVFVTFKHFSGTYSTKHSGRPPIKQLPKSVTGAEPNTPMLLIRATDGNSKKISAIVPARGIVQFQIQLDRVLRTCVVGFKKLDKPPAPRSP